MVRKYWSRLTRRDPETRFYFWIYLMYAATLAPGIAFTFFGNHKTVYESALYEATETYSGALSIWGASCILVVALAVANMLYRKEVLGRLASMLGYLTWAFALTVNAIDHYWLEAVTALIWTLFWAMHHIRINRYYRELKAGHVRMVS